MTSSVDRTPHAARTAGRTRGLPSPTSNTALKLLFILLGALFAMCLTLALLPVFLITPPFTTVALTTFVTTVILTLLTWGRKQSVIVLILALLAAIGFALFSGTPLTERIETWSQTIAEAVGLLNAHATAENGGTPLTADQTTQLADVHRMITTAISVIVAALSYGLAGRLKWPWPMTLLITAVLTAKLVIGREAGMLWLVPAGLITLWIFVWSNRIENDGADSTVGHFAKLALQTGVPLVLALAIAALTVPHLDYWQVHSPQLRSITEDIVALLPQNQEDQFQIYNFSIRQAGYYPLGDRLGGPLQLTDDPLLDTWGEPGYFMKGTSADVYTGTGWENTQTNPHYRFNSAFNSDEQRLVMPTDPPILDYLPEAHAETATESYQYAVRPIMDNVQVIFSDGLLTDVRTERNEPNQFYFNQSGVVYAKDIFEGNYPFWGQTFGLQPEIIPGYYFTDPSQAAESVDAQALTDAISQMEDDGVLPTEQDHAFEHYTGLPELPAYEQGGVVRNLSENLTQGARTDYEKIMLLFNFLARNPEFTYSTDVVVPPEGSEFVTHFLTTQTGYCTYYATALTMMARSVGIPARYVEGFSVPPELQAELRAAYDTPLDALTVEDGSILDQPNVTLTPENAHAWTEVYLYGIGWVPMDPTPGGAGGQSLPVMYESEPEPLSPTPTPAPDQTGTPTPTPAADDPTVTPIATPTGRAEDPTTPDNTFSETLMTLLRIVLVLAILAAVVYLYYQNRLAKRRTYHDPEALATLVPDPTDQALTYWAQIARLTALLPPGHAPDRLSLSVKTAWHLSNKPDALKPVREDLIAATRIAQRIYFSPEPPTGADLTRLATTFDALETTVESALPRPHYLFLRLLRPRSFSPTLRDSQTDAHPPTP